MADWQFWIGVLSLIGLGNIGAFWYGYGKLNQKVDSGFENTTRRLDAINGSVGSLRESARSQGERIARLEGSSGASLGD